jgi:hypothetical protein
LDGTKPNRAMKIFFLSIMAMANLPQPVSEKKISFR